jgi:glycosyltransferase involved in cell wall biosynthesis
MAQIQSRLDRAQAQWPTDSSLTDFRVNAHDCETERRALLGATRLITAHADVAKYLATLGVVPVQQLAWHQANIQADFSSVPVDSNQAPLVVFPASSLGRKGAREMAQAIRSLGWRLLVLGSPASDTDLWQGIEVQYASRQNMQWLRHAHVVALPAYVEHAPRALLTALAHNIPVIATPHCGLPTNWGVIEVPAGDVDALKLALQLAVSVRACARPL